MSDTADVVKLAIGAAGPATGDQWKWQQRVSELTATIAAMLRPPAPGHEEDASTPAVTARKILDASVFRADFVGFTVVEERKRLEVAFRSPTTDKKDAESDGTERLVTEPWWTPAGMVMRRRIEQLDPGTPVAVFKYNEPIEGGRKNVRVLVHFDVMGRPKTRQAGEGNPPPPSQAGRQVAQREPAPAGPPPSQGGDWPFDPSEKAASRPSDNGSLIGERFSALTTRQQIAFAHLCRGGGITNFMDPDDEHLDEVLLNLSRVEKGE